MSDKASSSREGLSGASQASQPLVEEVAATPPEVMAEEDSQSTSSKRSDSPGRGGPMYKICQSCKKGNKLMATDLHEECMLCLGTEHLFAMKTSQPCQALGYKDRLERARRFSYQRATGRFMSARQTRSFVAKAESLPPSLLKERLEPYIVDSEAFTSTPKKRRPVSATVSIPPKRLEAARAEDRSRSLLLRAVSTAKPSSGSALSPIRLSSPEHGGSPRPLEVSDDELSDWGEEDIPPPVD